MGKGRKKMAFSLPPSLSFIQKKRETGAQKKSNSINRTFLYPPHIILFPAANLIGPIVAANIRESKKSVQFWGRGNAGKRCACTRIFEFGRIWYSGPGSRFSLFLRDWKERKARRNFEFKRGYFLRFFVCYVRIGCESFLEISKKVPSSEWRFSFPWIWIPPT